MDNLYVSMPPYNCIKVLASAIETDHKAIVGTDGSQIMSRHKHKTAVHFRRKLKDNTHMDEVLASSAGTLRVLCARGLDEQGCIKAPCVDATLESSGVEIMVFFRS